MTDRDPRDTPTYGSEVATRRQRSRRTSDQIREIVTPTTPLAPRRSVEDIVADAVAAAIAARDEEWEERLDHERTKRRLAEGQLKSLWLEYEALRRETGQ